MFENNCNQTDTGGWEVRLMLFRAMAVQVLLYGVELWAGIISLSTWNEIEIIQKMFLRRQSRLKSSTSYPIMLLDTGTWPIEILPHVKNI